jgi:tetratricopeptide (TPR) repeat protein
LDEAGLDLLKRMCVLRVEMGVQGVTFLRTLTGSSAEVAKTEDLLERLTSCSLIQSRYDRELGEFYYLHKLIADFLRIEFQAERMSFLERAYRFYREYKIVDNPQFLEDLSPRLEAYYFACQLGNFSEADNLLDQLYRYLRPWGYRTILLGLYKQIVDCVPDDSKLFALQRIGTLEKDLGNWNKAQEYYEAGLRLAEKYKNKPFIVSLIGQLGDIELKRCNFLAAESSYRKCLHLCEEMDDKSGMAANAWGQLGYIEKIRGNFDAAEKLYRKSLQLRKKMRHLNLMPNDWAAFGSIKLERGQFDIAEKLFRVYEQRCGEGGDESDKAMASWQLGQLENARENWDAAERLYQKSWKLRERLKDRRGMARSISGVGQVHLKRGNLEAAKNLLNMALDHFENLNDRLYLAETNYRLMQLEIKRHNPTAAQTHYTTAHNLYTQLGAAKDLERIEQEWNALE